MNVRFIAPAIIAAGLMVGTVPALAGPAPSGGTHAGGHGAAPGHPHSPREYGQPGDASKVTRSIEVVMLDNFYEPEKITVTEGETIRFLIVNKGEFVHEFNIGTAALHEAHQAEMMTMMEHGVLEPDKINHDMMKMDMGGGRTMEHDDPNSVLLEPGKSAEIVWTFAKADNIEVACNVPGHYEAGMVAHLTVTPGTPGQPIVTN